MAQTHGLGKFLDYSKSDIFAVGMVAHNMLSGDDDDDAPFATKDSRLYSEANYNALADAAGSEELRNFVWRMLNPVPSARVTLAEAEMELGAMVSACGGGTNSGGSSGGGGGGAAAGRGTKSAKRPMKTAPVPSGHYRICTVCGVAKEMIRYSSTQWQKPDALSKCKPCVKKKAKKRTTKSRTLRVRGSHAARTPPPTPPTLTRVGAPVPTAGGSGGGTSDADGTPATALTTPMHRGGDARRAVRESSAECALMLNVTQAEARILINNGAMGNS
jgi:hypothetical protein